MHSLIFVHLNKKNENIKYNLFNLDILKGGYW